MISQTVGLSDNLTGNHKRGCTNRPPADSFPAYRAQNGWDGDKPVWVMVTTHWDGKGCKYEKRASDAVCGTCKWRAAP